MIAYRPWVDIHHPSKYAWRRTVIMRRKKVSTILLDAEWNDEESNIHENGFSLNERIWFNQ